IGPTWTVAAGQTTTAPPARHSAGGGKRNGSTLWSCAPVGAVPVPGCDTPPQLAARSMRPGDIFGVTGDPSTSRSGARTFRRITGHMAAPQPSSRVRWETHDVRRGRQFYGVEIRFPPATPAPAGRRVGAGRRRGARARPAIRTTALHEGAIQRSGGAAH